MRKSGAQAQHWWGTGAMSCTCMAVHELARISTTSPYGNRANAWFSAKSRGSDGIEFMVFFRLAQLWCCLSFWRWVVHQSETFCFFEPWRPERCSNPWSPTFQAVLKYFYINQEIKNHHKVSYFRFIWIPHVMNLTSIDVRFSRLKSIPAPKGLM